jgi:hypothetical protein
MGVCLALINEPVQVEFEATFTINDPKLSERLAIAFCDMFTVTPTAFTPSVSSAKSFPAMLIVNGPGVGLLIVGVTMSVSPGCGTPGCPLASTQSFGFDALLLPPLTQVRAVAMIVSLPLLSF